MPHRILSMKLGIKIPMLVVAVAAAVGVGVGVAGYQAARAIALDGSAARIEAIASVQKARLTDFLASVEAELLTLARQPSLAEALHAFERGFDETAAVAGDAAGALQKAYILDNPNPTGRKQLLDRGAAGTGYDLVHARYHGWLRDLVDTRGFYDAFLISNDGDVVYTVFKEPDFASNVVTGEWAGTDLGAAFRGASAAQTPGEVFFYDFKPYAPSADAPAAFMATAIFDGDVRVGVLVIQMPTARLTETVRASQFMNGTGAAALIGTDLLLRNDIGTTEANDVLATRYDNALVRDALAGTAGEGVLPGVDGRRSFVEALPFAYAGVNYALLVTLDEAAVTGPIDALRAQFLMIGAAALAVALVVSLLFSRSVTAPLARLDALMKRLANGETDLRIDGAARRDEIGDMSRAVEVFRESAVARIALEAGQKRETEARLAREVNLRALVAGFRDSVGEVVSGIDGAAAQMSETAVRLSGVADETRSRTTSAAAASTQASTNVQTVASATEELSASIGEISGQLTRATEVVAQVTARASRTTAEVGELASAARRIGEVVEMIQEIAEQTNLLALNATIEAARAGDSGRGFAVVASEVKALANQTAKATKEISQQIAGIQGSTEGAVAAISEISRIMNEVNGITTSIAAAVEQQSYSTQEISRNVQEAASGTEDVARNVEGIAGAVDMTATSAGDVRSASRILNDRAAALNRQVGDFLGSVEAA